MAETEPRFLLDVMCGGLVAYLRMCGYDTAYAGERGLEADDDLLAVARAEERVVVTRDVELAGRLPEERSILLAAREVEDQLAELSGAGVSLELPDEPTRCGRCNGRLERVEPEERTPEYAPDPSGTGVWRCLECGQLFWKGSHWERVRETLSRTSQ
ncbi:Mut7-C RNAse domain-containing protein [Natrononativus amylolyticus]|uniref:Mut7-C RNAse domain-containing protein n=1 Tax=Natrononativus amylolyticus TaxID=2963434 RepID=UPI0020CFB0B5|nr:Mut7-C RNAse domain-containing protein [Natrononativus amylolyticus]